MALIDSGATENFMNLDYARWLKLPIKELRQHCPLFNVNGMENKSGALCYYTDLQFKTGTQTTNQRFYLSDLGDHKAIFGYPWFAAFQPRVDWKRGWIDMSQLPIILSAPNAAKATYTPRTKNIPQPIRKVTDQYLEGSPLCLQPLTNKTPQSQKNIKDIAKCSAKQSPKDYLNQLYGTMQLNYCLEHQTPSQEGCSHSHKKKKQKCTSSCKSTSKEGQSMYPSHPMQLISSL